MENNIDGADLKNTPRYEYSDVARYIGLSVHAVNMWVSDIMCIEEDVRFLSFSRLVEVYVLRAIHNVYKASYEEMSKIFEKYLLLHSEFKTDCVGLLDEMRNNHSGCRDMNDYSDAAKMMEACLDRIEYDKKGIAERLYPFLRPTEVGCWGDMQQSKFISIDPKIAFGNPMLVGTGIPIFALRDRYKGGDTVDELARDFNCDVGMVKEVVNFG